MAEQKNVSKDSDWEMSEDYYSGSEMKEMSLEDFIEEEEDASKEMPGASMMDELHRTAGEVEQILKLAQTGRNIEAIAKELNLEQEYVREVQLCAQSFPEDNSLAIARLIVFG